MNFLWKKWKDSSRTIEILNVKIIGLHSFYYKKTQSPFLLENTAPPKINCFIKSYLLKNMFEKKTMEMFRHSHVEKSFYIIHNVVYILHCTIKEMPKLKWSQSSNWSKRAPQEILKFPSFIFTLNADRFFQFSGNCNIHALHICFRCIASLAFGDVEHLHIPVSLQEG